MREQETARACGGNNAASPRGFPAAAAGLKAGGRKSSGIADISTVFPAWRMDDKRRIYALLAEADWEKICGLTERSFELLNGKK